MVSLQSILVIIAVITLALAAAGVIGGQYRISKNKTAIDVTKEIAEAWENKARAQETQIADLETAAQAHKERTTLALAAKDAEIADLSARVGLLQDLVTGKTAIENLSADHQRFDTKLAEILAQVGEARREVHEVAAILRDPRT